MADAGEMSWGLLCLKSPWTPSFLLLKMLWKYRFTEAPIAANVDTSDTHKMRQKNAFLLVWCHLSFWIFIWIFLNPKVVVFLYHNTCISTGADTGLTVCESVWITVPNLPQCTDTSSNHWQGWNCSVWTELIATKEFVSVHCVLFRATVCRFAVWLKCMRSFRTETLALTTVHVLLMPYFSLPCAKNLRTSGQHSPV